jgi:tetratricopeptide (TPR) repeat protein
VGEIDRTHYFAMELVDGQPLEEGMGRDKESILTAARVARDAARGLAHAHERGVIHRDVKPGNLLVDRTGRVVVTDFGLARLTDSASLTSTDAIVGTPKYMSPEQILMRATRPVDGRTDVYSLGATLFHVIAGRPPFEAPTVQGFIKAILEERPPSPRRLNRQVPFDLATIILRCLEKDPLDRYASAAELADDLDRFLAGERILAKPKGTLALATEALRRHRIIAALGAVAVLALGLTLVLGGRAREESRRAELEEALKTLAANEDLPHAIQEAEHLARSHPGNPSVRTVCARLYQRRAAKKLEALDPDFPGVIADLERAGQQGSFWHLMALVEAGRMDEARAGAEARPARDPLRRLTLARIAVAEERHAEALALLEEEVRDPDHPQAAAVFAAVTRGLAYRALGRQREAIDSFGVASNESAAIPEAWLRTRALVTFGEMGGDVREFLATILGRTVNESLRLLSQFRGQVSPEQDRIARGFVDAVLRIAKQPAVPATELERLARERLATATGGDRTVALLLLAIAQLNLGTVEAALETLDRAEEESVPALDPYVRWGRSLVLSVRGEHGLAAEAARQAIDLALASGSFPDLQYLCEHAALVATEAPPAEAQRATDYLKDKLEGLPPDAWVSELLSRLAAAAAPRR